MCILCHDSAIDDSAYESIIRAELADDSMFEDCTIAERNSVVSYVESKLAEWKAGETCRFEVDSAFECSMSNLYQG